MSTAHKLSLRLNIEEQIDKLDNEMRRLKNHISSDMKIMNDPWYANSARRKSQRNIARANARIEVIIEKKAAYIKQLDSL